MKKEEVFQKIAEWMVDGETGMSSKYLAAVILGGDPRHISYPFDPSDFNRCVKMCEFVGVPIEDAFASAASKGSKVWEAYAMHLSQLLRLYREECVGDNWRAPKLYDFMQEIQQHVER